MTYNVDYWCISHIGKIRSINQDNYICADQFIELGGECMDAPLRGTKSSKEVSVFGIFDGMGGEECGEVASYLAAKVASSLNIGKDPVDDLRQFCQKANADICSYAAANQIAAMGTTAAILVFSNKTIFLCNIGDTKVFRFCDGSLEQISKDHVSVAAFGVKPPLTQNLGIPPEELIIDPYLAQGPCHHGNVYLICSDGLTDMVTNEEISEILGSARLPDAGQTMLAKALEYGGKDNITIILLEICREEKKYIKFWKNGGRH